MDRELDRLVDVVASKVRLRLVDELKKVPCTATTEECNGDGLCAVRRPADVALIRDAGASRVGASPGIGEVRQDLAGLIDHTLLRPDATKEDLKKLCEEAKKYGFASVCVNSANVRIVKDALRGSNVMAVAVVGFPLGAMTTTAKAFETREAARLGADEIDMVINIGALKSRDYALVEDDIRAVVQAARPRPVKVILETGALTTEEKVIGCALSRAAGAAFVKTSTGFGPGGATIEDIALMRRIVGAELGVKASGGVRTTEDADKMVAAGATRIGASASVAIVSGKGAAAAGKY
jgi:deoxyribose-phosphate aldolase